MNNISRLLIAAVAAVPSASALACASCGCSLSSDWGSQGLSATPGWRMDLRLDYLNQNEVRSGTGKVGRWPLAGHEQELFTENHYLSATFDYGFNDNWGINVQLPYIRRSHGTNGNNFDGSDAGTSRTRGLGDVKVIGRYLGLADAHNFGLQFGVKLPTGSTTETFSGGALAGQPLDRGLQPGTGTADLIVGAFYFDGLSQNWDYFVQALYQTPTNNKDEYKPGDSLNLNVGLRYMALEGVVPQIQINARNANKDSGANATPADSGGQTIYLSPGVTVPISEKVKVYGFLQVPIYQNLNGYQLAPSYTLSLGTRIDF